MAWAMTVKELSEKISRIEELKQAGFNTPKMFFLKRNSSEEEIEKCLTWCDEIDHPIYNIRTYNFNEGKETLETTHHVDVKAADLPRLLKSVIATCNCMVDAEIPDDGRFAGNIVVHRNRLGRILHADIDYCQKEIRAMVRNADKSMQIPSFDFEQTPEPFRTIIYKACTFNKPEETILEWTYFSKPTGILNENLVWWEYRSYHGAQ